MCVHSQVCERDREGHNPQTHKLLWKQTVAGAFCPCAGQPCSLIEIKKSFSGVGGGGVDKDRVPSSLASLCTNQYLRISSIRGVFVVAR